MTYGENGHIFARPGRRRRRRQRAVGDRLAAAVEHRADRRDVPPALAQARDALAVILLAARRVEDQVERAAPAVVAEFGVRLPMAVVVEGLDAVLVQQDGLVPRRARAPHLTAAPAQQLLRHEPPRSAAGVHRQGGLGQCPRGGRGQAAPAAYRHQQQQCLL